MELIKKFGLKNLDSEVWGSKLKPDKLDIIIKDRNDDKASFRVERNSFLANLVKEFANSHGINMFEHKFAYNGKIISNYDTPARLEMKNGDTIDVILLPVEFIQISIQDMAGEELFFRIKTSTKMGQVFRTYASRKGMEVSSLRFIFGCDRIKDDETPGCLEMNDFDVIDCVLDQGGC